MAAQATAEASVPAPRNDDVAVVVPVYNEAQVVGSVVKGVLEHFSFVVCIDDGSSDGSADQVALAGARLVQHAVNLGAGAAMQTGLDYVLAHPQIRYVITFDADGQHRVEDALAMLAELRTGEVDIVFGSRFLDRRTSMSPARRVVLRLATVFTNLTSRVPLTDAHNGLRAFTREVAAAFDIRQNRMAHGSEVIGQVGEHHFRYREHPVHILYTDYSRAKGQPLMNSVNIVFDLFFR